MNDFGEGGRVSFAALPPRATKPAYGGSIAKMDELFENEANSGLEIIIDDYIVKVDSDKIKVYEKQAGGKPAESTKTIQQVLTEVFGNDQAPYYLHAVLGQLLTLDLRDKTIDLKALVEEVKTKNDKEVEKDAVAAINQDKINKMDKDLKREAKVAQLKVLLALPLYDVRIEDLIGKLETEEELAEGEKTRLKTLLKRAKEKVAAEKAGEAEKKQKATIATIQADISNAPTLAALQIAYTTNKITIDADETLKTALLKKFVVLLKTQLPPLQKDYLQFLADLDPSALSAYLVAGEYLISFTDSNGGNSEYVAVVKKGGKGPWTFVTPVEAGREYYIEEDKNENPVVKSEQGFPDTVFITTVLLKNRVDALKPRFIKVKNGNDGTKFYYVANSGVFVEWVDADKDRKIDRSEGDSVRFTIDTNGDGQLDTGDQGVDLERLSYSLFTAFDNEMETMDGNYGDNEIDTEELSVGLPVIAEYADIAGIELKAAIKEYNESNLEPQDLAALRTEKESLKKIREEVKLQKSEGKRTLLSKTYGFCPTIIDIFLDHEKDAEVWLLRYALASYTGHSKPYKIEKSYLDQMDPFNPTVISQEALQAWFKGEEIEEDSATASSSGTSRGWISNPETARRELIKAQGKGTLAAMREWWDSLDEELKGYNEFLHAMFNAFHKEGTKIVARPLQAEKRFTTALKFAQKMGDAQARDLSKTICNTALNYKMYALALEAAKVFDDQELIEFVFTAALDAGELKIAEQAAKTTSDQNKNIRQLALLAAECLKSREQKVRRNAVALLGSVKDLDSNHEFSNSDRNTPEGEKEGAMVVFYRSLGVKVTDLGEGVFSVRVEDLLTAAKEAAEEDTDTWFYQYDLLEIKFEGERREERERQGQPAGSEISLRSASPEKRQAAIEAITNLDEIIKNPSTNAYTKARAHYVRGLLLYALSKGIGPDAKVEINKHPLTISELQDEAMFELRAAWEEAANIEENSLQAQKLRREIWGRMVDIVDFVRYAHSGKDPERKTRTTELAEFIPDSTDSNMLYAVCQFKSGSYFYKKMDPRNTREVYKARKDRYKNYSPKLSASTTLSRAPTPTSKIAKGNRSSKDHKKTEPPPDPTPTATLSPVIPLSEIDCALQSSPECEAQKAKPETPPPPPASARGSAGAVVLREPPPKVGP